MSSHVTADDAVQARDHSSDKPTTRTPGSTDKGKAIDELPLETHEFFTLTSMPAEIVLNISSHLHFPDRRSLLNTCRVLRDNKMAWKEALVVLEKDWVEASSKTSWSHDDPDEDSHYFLFLSGLDAVGYSAEDVKGLHRDAAFCFGCFRFRSSVTFAINGRFGEMNQPTAYYDDENGIRSNAANDGSRRCMDCLAEEGLPSCEEPWLVPTGPPEPGVSSHVRGRCKECLAIFELSAFPASRRQRRAILCNNCWELTLEQKQWRATMAQLEELKKPLEVYLEWMRDRDRDTGTDYQDRGGHYEPRGLKDQLVERGLAELPSWTQISERYGRKFR